MEITVTIPPSVENHLRTYAASLFFETTPYALSRAVLAALINQLDAACVVSREEIVQGILDASKPPVSELAPVPQPEATATTEKEPPAEPAPAQKAAPTVEPITDPKKLKVPGEIFQKNISNTWLVWGWGMASTLNLVTPESVIRKFHSFNLDDVVQGVMQKKRVRINERTVYSALDVLVKRQWLTYNSKTKLYTLSSVAQKWVLTPKNQDYLIDKGFLDRIE